MILAPYEDSLRILSLYESFPLTNHFLLRIFLPYESLAIYIPPFPSHLTSPRYLRLFTSGERLTDDRLQHSLS